MPRYKYACKTLIITQEINMLTIIDINRIMATQKYVAYPDIEIESEPLIQYDEHSFSEDYELFESPEFDTSVSETNGLF